MDTWVGMKTSIPENHFRGEGDLQAWSWLVSRRLPGPYRKGVFLAWREASFPNMEIWAEADDMK